MKYFLVKSMLTLELLQKKGKNRQLLKDKDKKSVSSSGCGQQLSPLNEGCRKGKTSNIKYYKKYKVL